MLIAYFHKTIYSVWCTLQIYAQLFWSFIETENKDKTLLPQPKREEEVLEQGMYASCNSWSCQSIHFQIGNQNLKLLRYFRSFFISLMPPYYRFYTMYNSWENNQLLHFGFDNSLM